MLLARHTLMVMDLPLIMINTVGARPEVDGSEGRKEGRGDLSNITPTITTIIIRPSPSSTNPSITTITYTTIYHHHHHHHFFGTTTSITTLTSE